MRSPNAESPLTALPEVKVNAVPKTPKKHKDKSGGLSLVPAGSENAVPTPRQAIEARKERKLMSMLATDPSSTLSGSTLGPGTGTFVSFSDETETKMYDASASIADRKSIKTDSVGSRSPKKKFLGITVPSFMSSSGDVASSPLETFPMPPPTKSLPESPATPAARKRSNSNLKRLPKREDGVSYLPSKMRDFQIPIPQEKALPMDSPTLGRMAPLATGHTTGGANRAVSDGVTKEWEKEAKERERRAQEESLGRSKSFKQPSVRDDGEVTVPPTPLPKDTPPKLVLPIANLKPNKSSLGIATKFGGVADRDRETASVKKVQQYNNYLDLIHHVPSMYSLHGDIQHHGSQSAGILESSTKPDLDSDTDYNNNSQPPTMYDSRWSEGQMSAWQRIHQAKYSHGLNTLSGRDQITPHATPAGLANYMYSPSLYSVAWSPTPTLGHEKTSQKATYNVSPIVLLHSVISSSTLNLNI